MEAWKQVLFSVKQCLFIFLSFEIYGETGNAAWYALKEEFDILGNICFNLISCQDVEEEIDRFPLSCLSTDSEAT